VALWCGGCSMWVVVTVAAPLQTHSCGPSALRYGKKNLGERGVGEGCWLPQREGWIRLLDRVPGADDLHTRPPRYISRHQLRRPSLRRASERGVIRSVPYSGTDESALESTISGNQG